MEQPPPQRRGPARPHLAGELALVAALLFAYDALRALATVHAAAAFSNGWTLLRVEAALHLRVEDNLNGWLSGRTVLGFVASQYYEFMHATVLLVVLAACYVRRPGVYRRARNALVVVNVVGLAIFALYPVAPPRLLPGSGFVDSVAQAGFGTSHGAITADQYGAMPSLHLAWATWAAITVFAMTRRRGLRALVVAHVVVTAVVVVATANHYVLDVVVGTVLALAAAPATGLLRPQHEAGVLKLASA